MTFDYDYYLSANLTGKIIPMLLFAAVAAGNTILAKKKGKQKDKWQWDVSHLLGLLSVAVVWGGFLLYHTVPMFRGGFALLNEKPADAVTVTGTVEALQEQPWYFGEYYRLEDDNTTGWQVVIEGETYRMMHHANLTVGDAVTAEALPRSGFILSVEKTQ